MNRIILTGRLTKDPEIWRGNSEDSMTVARYTLAVDKKQRRDDGKTDYFRIVAFDKRGEFAEKYLNKGMKVMVSGHVQTGTYDTKDGVKMPFFEVVADEQEFAENKNTYTQPEKKQMVTCGDSEEDIDDLPFN